MNCSLFRRSIYHFQADELPSVERRALQEHLDACPDCAARLEIEDSFLRVLKCRLQATPAAPGLETRIRSRLEERRQAARGFTGWLRAPWFAAAAVSLMLALLLVSWIDSPRDSTRLAQVLPVEREVVVVDRECDYAGRSLIQQRACASARHLNALKLADGSYWNIGADRATARELLVDREMRGHRVRVRGELYPAIETVRLTRVQDLGPVAAALLFD